MAQPRPPSPRPDKDAPPPGDAPKDDAADQRAGVRRQRQHIKDLTGEDPLRGGVAD